MRLLYALPLLGCMLISSWSLAQSSSKPTSKQLNEKISNIKAPSAPAAIIVGNQPSVVNRPKTFQALETGLFTNFTSTDNQNLVIPNNYSLEFSPYWAGNDIQVPMADYLAPSMGQSIAQNFSISLSSTQNFVIQDSINSNALGFGMRTMLWSGSKGEKEKLLSNGLLIMKNLKISSKIFQWARKVECEPCTEELFIKNLMAVIREKQADIFDESVSTASRKRVLKEMEGFIRRNLHADSKMEMAFEISDIIDDFLKLDALIRNTAALRKDRKGFKLELAGAMALDFPTNQTDFSVVPKYGFWITPSFQPYNADWIEVLGVARVFRYNFDFYNKYLPGVEVFDQTIDYGVRLAFKWQKFTIEFEGVGRSSETVIEEFTDADGFTTKKSKTDTDFQYLGNFNYQIKENLSISYNFGKQFNPLLNYNGDLISLATLNFGIAAPKAKDLVRQK